MTKTFIAIGSTRRPKVEAVREAVSTLAEKMPNLANFELVPVEVESGVTHTPLSREETMLGARQRAEALMAMGRSQNQPWNYFVGLEGGLDVIKTDGGRLVFLQNWAYVTDGSLASYGQSVACCCRSRSRGLLSIRASSYRTRSTLSPGSTAFATGRAPGAFLRAA
jgi:non-canonical (house-cleaning) NTP pyrophosphatase